MASIRVVEIFEPDCGQHGVDFLVVRPDVAGDETAQFFGRRRGPGRKIFLPLAGAVFFRHLSLNRIHGAPYEGTFPIQGAERRSASASEHGSRKRPRYPPRFAANVANRAMVFTPRSCRRASNFLEMRAVARLDRAEDVDGGDIGAGEGAVVHDLFDARADGRDLRGEIGQAARADR